MLSFDQVYVEYVVYNPLCQLCKPIESELFAVKLDEVVKQSPAYASRPAWVDYLQIVTCFGSVLI